jgi:hypothetical protein
MSINTKDLSQKIKNLSAIDYNGIRSTLTDIPQLNPIVTELSNQILALVNYLEPANTNNDLNMILLGLLATLSISLDLSTSNQVGTGNVSLHIVTSESQSTLIQQVQSFTQQLSTIQIQVQSVSQDVTVLQTQIQAVSQDVTALQQQNLTMKKILHKCCKKSHIKDDALF